MFLPAALCFHPYPDYNLQDDQNRRSHPGELSWRHRWWRAESFNALYKASVHVKQKKEGAKDEFIEAQNNLELKRQNMDPGMAAAVSGSQYHAAEVTAKRPELTDRKWKHP